MLENIQGVKTNSTRGHDVGHTKTIASFFSGYGGLEMGIRLALGGECRTIVFVEREAFAVANLVAKIEEGLLDAAPIHTDVTTFPYGKFRGLVDIACGGVPCQPHSVAGKRNGGSDERFLFDVFFDGLEEMQPGQIFIENVEGLLTSKMPDGSLCFRYIIERLEKMDYSVKAGLFTAAEVGAPHRRKRVFILAHSRRFRPEIGQVPSAGVIESGELAHSPSNKGWVFNGERGNRDELEKPIRIGRGGRSEGGSEVRGCGREVSTDTDGEECGTYESTGTGTLSRYGSQESVAYTGSTGWQGCEQRGTHHGADSERSGAHGATPQCGPQRWPARPGQPQYDWEAPRITESKVGGAANGTGRRVDELRLLGNGVVPQQAERAWIILNKEMKNEN